MDKASLFSVLQDKDSFIVKLPHKFKEYLVDSEAFTLTKRDAEIGRLVETTLNPEHRGPTRPTIEELLAPDSGRDFLMRLNLPRQVIVDDEDPRKRREPEPKRLKTVVDEVYFDI